MYHTCQRPDLICTSRKSYQRRCKYVNIKMFLRQTDQKGRCDPLYRLPRYNGYIAMCMHVKLFSRCSFGHNYWVSITACQNNRRRHTEQVPSPVYYLPIALAPCLEMSRLTLRQCRCHCRNKLAGYYPCANCYKVRRRLCSAEKLPHVNYWLLKKPRGLTCRLNWFDVPSMQTMSFFATLRHLQRFWPLIMGTIL